jgi:hypothetical protein
LKRQNLHFQNYQFSLNGGVCSIKRISLKSIFYYGKLPLEGRKFSSGITFIRYTQSLKIEKPNNLNVFGSK